MELIIAKIFLINNNDYISFLFRFDPSFDDIYQRVRNGAVGQVHQIKLTR